MFSDNNNPASKSIISCIFSANALLLDILMTGATGFPVGVPSPVVNKIKLQPDAASAVVDSTSR